MFHRNTLIGAGAGMLVGFGCVAAGVYFFGLMTICVMTGGVVGHLTSR